MSDKITLIKQLGDSLEIIVKGVESEDSEIYLNYLEKLNKLTSLFIININKELAQKKEENNSDNEYLIKKYENDVGDIDSVSEYSEYENDSDIDSNIDSNIDSKFNKKQINKSLEDFDNKMREIYNNLLERDIFIKK